MSDAAETTVILVSRPEVAALREANRTRGELAELGIRNQVLAINGLFTTDRQDDDAIATAMVEGARQALDAMPPGLAGLPQTRIPFLPRGTVGLQALRDMAHPERVQPPKECRMPETALPPGLRGLVDEMSKAGHGVIMTMGKGGVGKTTVAAAIAVALARKGHKVVLSTTDPASHVADTIDGVVPGLSVTRIDPALEVRKYTTEVLAKAGAQLDAGGRAMLEEDLRSPCTEEIAVFRAFARTVDEGKSGFVVLDTAPTGHTILLLDAAEAYHREVMRTQGDMPEAVRELLPRLRDPGYTHVLIVTLPEATPVHEAERLKADLARAGIAPYAWVINQSLLASGTTHPMLCQRGTYEVPFIRRVADTLSQRTALIPWLAEAPIGEVGLENVIR